MIPDFGSLLGAAILVLWSCFGVAAVVAWNSINKK